MKTRIRLILMLSCLLLINCVIQFSALPALARKESSVAYMKQTMLVLLDPELKQQRDELHAPVQRAISIYTRAWDKLNFCVNLSFLMTIIILGGLFYVIRQGAITPQKNAEPPPVS